jgi:hypothetical protein
LKGGHFKDELDLLCGTLRDRTKKKHSIYYKDRDFRTMPKEGYNRIIQRKNELSPWIVNCSSLTGFKNRLMATC